MGTFSHVACGALMVMQGGFLAQAGELTSALQAKFIKVICSSAAGVDGIICRDPAVAVELSKLGVKVDSGSKVAWASSDGDVKTYKAAGKLVICSRMEMLPLGGSVAVVEEGGKPAVYLHMSNISASGVTLSDAILKIGRRM